jgi:cytidine deaminase
MDLIEEAEKAMKNAHAPYSGFPVGVAVVGNSGKVYLGCNTENACINAGICAEPIAIGQAIVQGEKKITKIGVINKTESPCPPCGHCLQIISEFAGRDCEIISSNGSKTKIVKYTLAELLPITYDGFFQK